MTTTDDVKQLRLPMFEGKQPEDADLKISGEVALSSFDQDALHYGQTVIVVAMVRVKSVAHEMVSHGQDDQRFTRRHKGEVIGAYRIDTEDLEGFTPREATALYDKANAEHYSVNQRRRDEWTGQRSMDALLKEGKGVAGLVDQVMNPGDGVELESITYKGQKHDLKTGEITEDDDTA